MASVLKAYSDYVFHPFFFLRTTAEGALWFKILILLNVFIKIPFYVFFRGIKIIHIHGASRKSFIRKRILINYCSLFPVDIIFHLHGGEFRLFTDEYGAKKIKETFRKCKNIVVLSQQWENFIHDTISNYDTVVINNIVPYPQKQNVEKNDHLIRLLYLGIIGERKGVFVLLQCITVNKDNYNGKIKIIIGGNGETDQLKQHIADNQLESIIEYAGWVSGEGKIKLLNECDVYILPSYNEGLPISILEAMSYGKAIISTNVGGIPEIVKDGKNGYLITAGDIEALEKSVNHFLENNEMIQSFGAFSEQMIKDFLPDNVASQLETMYREILKK
jgi:glycosyltransferase involved in cell wall biosynthesis